MSDYLAHLIVGGIPFVQFLPRFLDARGRGLIYYNTQPTRVY